MSHDDDNLERRLAERLDGMFSPAERAELDRHIAENPAVASSARAYARLNELLGSWRRLDGAVDWNAFSAQVSEHLAADVGAAASAQIDATLDPDASPEESVTPAPHYAAARASLQSVDDLVQDWAQPLSNIDWEEFKSRVSAAVRDEAARPSYAHRARLQRSGLRRALFIGVPLAAAAAIALVAFRPRVAPVEVAPPADEPATLIAVRVDEPDESGKITVAFDETMPKGSSIEPSLPTSSGIAVGPSVRDSSEPVDVAVLY